MKESPRISRSARRKALEASDPAIPSSMIYTYAALMRRAICERRAELSVDIPAMMALAQQLGAGRREGLQDRATWMKTVVAPGIKARLLGVEGWYSTNILGNRMGSAGRSESFKTKEESKKSVLDYTSQPHLSRTLRGPLPRRAHQLLPPPRGR